MRQEIEKMKAEEVTYAFKAEDSRQEREDLQVGSYHILGPPARH